MAAIGPNLHVMITTTIILLVISLTKDCDKHKFLLYFCENVFSKIHKTAKWACVGWSGVGLH